MTELEKLKVAYHSLDFKARVQDGIDEKEQKDFRDYSTMSKLEFGLACVSFSNQPDHYRNSGLLDELAPVVRNVFVKLLKIGFHIEAAVMAVEKLVELSMIYDLQVDDAFKMWMRTKVLNGIRDTTPSIEISKEG